MRSFILIQSVIFYIAFNLVSPSYADMYLVPDSNDPSKMVLVGAKGFIPTDSIKVPDDLSNEKVEWLKIEESEDKEGELVREIKIDESKKQAYLQAEQEKKLQEQTRAEKVSKLRNDFASNCVENYGKYFNEDPEQYHKCMSYIWHMVAGKEAQLGSSELEAKDVKGGG